MSKRNTVAALVLNILMFVIMTGVEISFFCGNTDEIIPSGGASFKFFTIDSNLLAAAAALFCAVCEARILRGTSDTLPRFAVLLKYMASVGLTLTFLVVVLYLIPVYGVYTELHDENVHLHVIAPIICFITAVFLEKSGRLSLRDSLWGIVPVLLYGAVYFIMVIVIGKENGGWSDFYQFNIGGRWYITAPVILLFAYGIAAVIRMLKNRFGTISER